RSHVGPDGFVRAEGFAGRRLIVTAPVAGKNDLVNRRVRAAGPLHAVVEDQSVSLPRQALVDPLRVVLAEQLLVLDRAGAVGTGVAPAVEDIAALAVAAALVAGGIGRGRAVVDDPDLAELVDAQHDLVQLRVVGHAVDVQPVRLNRLRASAGVADVADAP